GFGTREDFLRVAREAAPIRDIAPAAASLEGFLFPATYGFPRNATAEQVAGAMVARFRAVWNALPQEGRNPHQLEPLELLTLASLVERETGAPGERPLIAGVFYNRLAKRIALQCDPTVIYAMELAGKNDGIIHLSDLRMKSPYNTYLNRGLPPGPIANPGEEAMRAALFPPQTDYFYFVSDTQGGHFFSRTHKEHNENVAKYRRLAGLPPKPPAANGTAAKDGTGKKPRPTKRRRP
ncbi:MAG: endolytic transglycosylase MltG, partial [Candidatus Acidiferrales bacterium]